MLHKNENMKKKSAASFISRLFSQTQKYNIKRIFFLPKFDLYLFTFCVVPLINKL